MVLQLHFLLQVGIYLLADQRGPICERRHDAVRMERGKVRCTMLRDRYYTTSVVSMF